MKRLLFLALALAACGKRETPAPAPAPPAPTPTAGAPKPVAPPAPAPTPAPPPAAPVIPEPYKQRPGGPSIPDCEKAADHLQYLVVNAVDDSTAEEREYISKLIGANRSTTMRYCLEVAVPKEIVCVVAAKSFDDLAGCSDKRRELSEELVAHTEPTQADCEKFFDRLRQFKLGEGVTPGEIDKDRDQIIRSCQEKAKAGTIACFIASPTYEQARRCP